MNPPQTGRIQRVISGLIPGTSFEGEYGAPRELSERMAFYHTPGLSMALIEDFRLAWTLSFGVKQAGSLQPVTTQTMFEAGSVSKAIFSLAVMRLVEQGTLDLDEDVNAYLTSWKVPAREGWQPRITLRHLLSHSAGLSVHGFPGYQVTEPLPTLVQVLNGDPPANTRKVQVNILPGLQFRYSGGGTSVAQQALCDVLKLPFPEIMRSLVLEPLGMANSTYEQPLPPALQSQAATAHPSKGVPLQGKYHVYPEMAAAGLWTTAEDLARAGVELMRILSGKKKTGLLARQTVESMLLPQLPGQTQAQGDYVGLAMFCEGKAEGFNFGHGGWDEGFVTLWRLYPAIGKGFAVMANSNEGFELFDEIRRGLAREYAWPGVYPPEKKALAVDQAGLFAGEYATPDGAKFTITATESGLALGLGDQPLLPLFASSALEFYARSVGASLTFEKDGENQVKSLTLVQDGRSYKAEKVGK